MRTDSPNLTSGTVNTPASREANTARSLIARLLPWLSWALVFGTSVAVASYSWWLIPPYLALMGFLLFEPASRRVNATNPTEPVTIDPKVNHFVADPEQSTDVNSTQVDQPTDHSVASSTAVKTRRAAKTRAKKVRQVIEPAPAAWIQVAPGKFVRVEPGNTMPDHETELSPTESTPGDESSPIHVEPIEDDEVSTAPRTDVDPENNIEPDESPSLLDETAAHVSDLIEHEIESHHAELFDPFNPPSEGNNLPVITLDENPEAEAVVEPIAQESFATFSHADDFETDTAHQIEDDLPGNEPGEPDAFLEAEVTEPLCVDESAECFEQTEFDCDNGVEAELVDEPVESIVNDFEDPQSDETDDEFYTESSEFHDATELAETNDWDENTQEDAVDESLSEAEASLEWQSQSSSSRLRPIPPSRENVRSARVDCLPTGFRRRSPRGVGRQRHLVRAFPPRSPP